MVLCSIATRLCRSERGGQIGPQRRKPADEPPIETAVVSQAAQARNDDIRVGIHHEPLSAVAIVSDPLAVGLEKIAVITLPQQARCAVGALVARSITKFAAADASSIQ